MPDVILCAFCSKAVFDDLWGEYKCSERGVKIYEDVAKCDLYKKGTPKLSDPMKKIEKTMNEK